VYGRHCDKKDSRTASWRQSESSASDSLLGWLGPERERDRERNREKERVSLSSGSESPERDRERKTERNRERGVK